MMVCEGGMDHEFVALSNWKTRSVSVVRWCFVVLLHRMHIWSGEVSTKCSFWVCTSGHVDASRCGGSLNLLILLKYAVVLTLTIRWWAIHHVQRVVLLGGDLSRLLNAALTLKSIAWVLLFLHPLILDVGHVYIVNIFFVLVNLGLLLVLLKVWIIEVVLMDDLATNMAELTLIGALVHGSLLLLHTISVINALMRLCGVLIVVITPWHLIDLAKLLLMLHHTRHFRAGVVFLRHSDILGVWSKHSRLLVWLHLSKIRHWWIALFYHIDISV